jgi:hypothetical protein
MGLVPAQPPAMGTSTEYSWTLLLPLSDEVKEQDYYSSSHGGPEAEELGTPFAPSAIIVCSTLLAPTPTQATV